MNGLMPVNNPFGLVDDREEAGFDPNLENTFWILHKGVLLCGGNLVAAPEFRHRDSFFYTMKPLGRVFATKYHLHTSKTQIERLLEIFTPSNRNPWSAKADPTLSMGFFIKLSINGTVHNIGLLLDECSWDHMTWNQNPSRKEWFATVIALHHVDYRISYIDDTIYDHPSQDIQNFIRINPFAVNYRKPRQNQIEAGPKRLTQ